MIRQNVCSIAERPGMAESSARIDEQIRQSVVYLVSVGKHTTLIRKHKCTQRAEIEKSSHEIGEQMRECRLRCICVQHYVRILMRMGSRDWERFSCFFYLVFGIFIFVCQMLDGYDYDILLLCVCII